MIFGVFGLGVVFMGLVGAALFEPCCYPIRQHDPLVVYVVK